MASPRNMDRRPSRTDMSDIGSPRGLRSMGSYTDVLSMSSKSVRATLPYAHPPPAYISDVEAEQLIFAEIERPVKVSESALRSVNGFLDQILYDILSRSHSTSLPAVRSAVPVILKQRLGRSAVQAADEELQDYIEEEEMEQVLSTPPVLDPKSDFDLDLAWKLTRLRCMVYAKLGNMEEEDEEDYLEDESLANHLARVSDSARASATITPPSAIFLTTVLEFLAEQALCIAAQHATKRHMTSKGAGKDGPTNEMMHDGQHVILLDDIDMSGVGKEGPLIRLWRSWKGSVRSGGSVSSRPTTPSILSPSSPESPNHEWKFPSIPPFSTIKEERSPSLKPRSSPLPADMPLPTNDDDIEEIEVPSRAHLFASEAENADGRPTLGDRRPSSMLILPGKFPDPSTSTAPEDVSRPGYQRKRSHSVPEGSQVAATSRGHVEVNGFASHHDTTEPFEELRDRSGATATDQAQGTFPEESQTGSSTLSNTISATVATIAGALSVEAARALGRGHSTPEKSTTAEPESGAAAGLGMNTAPRDSQNGVSDTPNHLASDSPVEGASDPEDLALSSADERDGRHTTQTNPRDSGFGVAAAGEDDLPVQGQVQDTTLDHPTGVHDLVTSAAEDPGHDRRGRTPQREYESSYTGAGEDAYRNDEELGTATIEVPPSNDLVDASMTRRPDASETAEILSSTNRNVDSPRFPQHLPTAQHVSGNEKPSEHVPDRVPRYATSSNLSQQAHSRTTSANDGRPTTAGSATARRQHIRLNTQTDELDRAQRSLDVLIDSDETLHYTLTPKSAREGIKPKVKSQTQELADFFRNTAPPGEESARPKSSRSAKDNLTGSRSNMQPTTKSHIPLVADAPPSPTVQQTSVSSPSRPKHRLGEPRDARMTRNNTRDLADYARSTGPENEMQLPKPLTTRPNTAQTEGSGAGAGASEGAGASDRASTTPGKPANRLKFQARDAQIPRTTESSDLIDFIREGPPRAPGDHRIDRRVAPFRSTMDSDDLNALAPPPELDANGRRSDGSNQESAVTVKSMQSSMNSRTGLLDSTNRTNERTTNGIRSAANAAPRQPIIPEADGMPTRTRRRVLDPYAIDYSDDEDEDMEDDFLPQQQQRRTDEESLVDFLRNTAPTPGMITQPILAAAPGSSSQPDTLNERSSNDKLKNFFEGSTSPRNGTMNRTTNGSAARAESPHLTQIGSKMDKYRPTQPTHAAHVERNRQKMRAEPRDATSSGGNDTADLAAYFKNSGPPPGMETQPQRLRTASKDQAGFLRFFQRKGSVGK
ncbi:hypothetical protein LTR10_020937 [Elasticomyces elasticus]|uniref:Uncharacterized protein n=1 Tax=Exophiala sideris TaxID=1016849 RepID=A0ABR0JBM3_9EURO|nr:hypothetical protein LTR10_020937 [Elasticomyces elasticus]KAK5031104.1 hypothetical protein LTS07_004839 [Exophiala sideris]KAK5038826.1 hypothetical protein LTR13_003857 [Exophiala sideris]KAK5060709.1 hypothetical protein LTR69_005308 [Exophiala sideris]KAK5183622.1 hypothetical protein LTR44_003904 [Eurotiomycetes sp. CCFEE 6388]